MIKTWGKEPNRLATQCNCNGSFEENGNYGNSRFILRIKEETYMPRNSKAFLQRKKMGNVCSKWV